MAKNKTIKTHSTIVTEAYRQIETRGIVIPAKNVFGLSVKHAFVPVRAAGWGSLWVKFDLVGVTGAGEDERWVGGRTLSKSFVKEVYGLEWPITK